MATKKDLVEAYSFSRRRLVTAFLSGAPGGREVEPSRPGRTVVGGIALAVLLVAAAAIASVLLSRTEEDWNKIGLVVSREEAAPYVILEEAEHPTLIPVINITSAQLILGPDRLDPTYVDQEVIEDQTPGDPIGILGAPQTLPRPHQLINSGWTACTDDGRGVHLDISKEPLTTEFLNPGVVVESEGAYYVIARSNEDPDDRRAYRYPLTVELGVDQMLQDLSLDQSAEAMPVPEAWVRLFPLGGELSAASFDIEGWGEPVDLPGLPAKAKVGHIVVDGEQAVVLTHDGPSPLDPFALAVLSNSEVPPKGKTPRIWTTEIPRVPGPGRTHDAALWPETLPDELQGAACARLDVSAGQIPKAQLVGRPQDEAAPDPESTTSSRASVSIDPGHGALFRVGDWHETASSSVHVVDPRGWVYTLADEETVEKLGYAGVDEPLVPGPWTELFEAGVSLSTSKALCPPTPVDDPERECHEPVE